MRARHLVLPCLTAVFAFALLPATAAAQLRLIPQVGLYAPLSDLPSAGDAAEVGERDATLAFGLAVELGNTEGTSFRVNGLRGTASNVPVDGFGCEDCARSTLTALTAAVVLRPIPDLILARPYAVLGGGLRRLDFEREDLDEEGFDALFSDENDLAAHVGLGVDLDLPLLRFQVELSDVVSSLDGPDGESEVQHDMFLTVGLVF